MARTRAGALLLLLAVAGLAMAMPADEYDVEVEAADAREMPPAHSGNDIGEHGGEIRSAPMGDDVTMTAHDGPPKGKFGVHLDDHKNHPDLKRYYDWKGAHDDGRKLGEPTAHLGAFAGKIDPDYLHHIVRDMHKEEL